jgi:hypothetical protein
MNLSPTVRYIIGALSVGVSTMSAALGSYGTIEPGVAIGLTVASAVLGYLQVPGQVGGTQEGLVNPGLTQPPPIEKD